ncbi:hypothetical protein V7195_23565 [Priestia megaterium]|uniref:hypothetical protein n=1 Tax=Priestia megaterium TaxID=1404 RepID=UPI000BF4D7B0|nr:hypothetical protein [Priestia megaterium]PFK03309.1 hypothetical protein COI96_03435 [Priestia megaterium]PMD10657.1 hypothetical protein CJ194_04020 [Priestia megaterium]
MKGEKKYDAYENTLRYHNNRDKMKEINSKYYVSYTVWFNELFDVGQTLISEYQEINRKANNQKGHLFTGKIGLNEILYELANYDNDLIDFRHDVAEYQRCVLAADVNQKHGYADALSDQLRFLDVIESKGIATVDRKLSNIDNTRMQGIFNY